VTVPADALADALWAAQQSRVPMGPPTTLSPGFDQDAAYAVQTRNIARRLAAGESIVGRKVGLTSEAMQRQLGVDQPDFGVITDAMVIPAGAVFDVAELIAPRLEAEFAFRLGTALAPDATLDQTRDAIAAVAPAIEIIDSRVADWKITLADTVADNASSARIVVGEWMPATPELLDGLPGFTLDLLDGDEVVGSGPGSAVLGDPVVALQWLARTLGAYGQGLAAGEVVLAGAVAASVPLLAGRTWSARSAELGTVSFVTAGSAG